MDTLKKDIKPWSHDRRKVGSEVYALIERDLRKVLIEAYSSVGERLDDIPEAMYRTELAKFRHIATGDFSDESTAAAAGVQEKALELSALTAHFMVSNRAVVSASSYEPGRAAA